MGIIVKESGGKIEGIMHMDRNEFIGIMLRMHQAHSSRKWRLMVKKLSPAFDANSIGNRETMNILVKYPVRTGIKMGNYGAGTFRLLQQSRNS